jgi:hypothetical protein
MLVGASVALQPSTYKPTERHKDPHIPVKGYLQKERIIFCQMKTWSVKLSA